LIVTEFEASLSNWLIDNVKTVTSFNIYREMCVSAKDSLVEQMRKDTASIQQQAVSEDFGTRCFPFLRRKVWDLLEHPQSSVVAKVCYFT